MPLMLPREDLIRATPTYALAPSETSSIHEIVGTSIALEAELRADSEGQVDADPVMYGHFAVFNRWTEIDSWWEGNFLERLSPGSFRKTFRENRDAIKVLFQHGMDFSIGDKPLGPIRTLKEDEIGGYDEVDLLDARYVREDILPGLKANLYGASFRFTVMREDIISEPDPSDYNPKGLPERTIKEVRLYEFGPVTFPAYAEASQGVRSMTDEYLVLRALRSQGPADERVGELIKHMQARGFAPSTSDAGSKSFHLGEIERRDDPEDDAETEPTEVDPPHLASAPVVVTSTARTAPVAMRSRNVPAPSTPSRDFSALDELITVADMQSAIAERNERLGEIDAAHVGGRRFDESTQQEWDTARAEIAELEQRIANVEERAAILAERAERAGNSEPGDGGSATPWSAPVPTSRGTTRVASSDILDPQEIRARSRSDEEYHQGMRDNAMRRVERDSFPHQDVDPARVRTHIQRLLDSIDYADPEHGKVGSELARRILLTGTPTYKRAFGKMLVNQPLTPEEQRALSIGTGSAGGFAVVYTLDPTIVPTSNSSVNPFRFISRVETISGTNEWKAVTSGAITASYAAEVTEATDNAPTLAQPDIIVEKAQAYVPFSIEVGQDWSSLQSDMAVLLADAKDDLEATKFTLGAGHGSTEPKGIITAATNTTTAGGTAAFAIADLYKVFEALPPRFRPRASWLGNLFTYDKVRQFDTAGGSGVWIAPQGLQPQIGASGSGAVQVDVGARLLGKPAYEDTAMSAALTTGQKILCVGDFRYFVIVDRVGMNIEVLPLVVGTNHRPTGQRGLYAYWRNSSDVLSAAAFQVLVTG